MYLYRSSKIKSDTTVHLDNIGLVYRVAVPGLQSVAWQVAAERDLA
jgi:hypothetical protein